MTQTKSHPDEKPRAPDEIHLPAKSFCGRCVYNIPSGTFMLLLPGLALVCTGIVILVWSSADTDVWHSGVTQAGLIVVVLGGLLTVGAVLYWAWMWCRTRPRGAPPPPAPGRATVSPQKFSGPVSLVGVYRLRQDGMSVPADAENGHVHPGT